MQSSYCSRTTVLYKIEQVDTTMSSPAKAEKRRGKGRSKESRQVGVSNEDPPSDAASRRISENSKGRRSRKSAKKSREATSDHDDVDGEAAPSTTTDGTASRIDATYQKSRKNRRKNHRSNISIDSDTDDGDDPPSSSEDEDDRPGAHAIAAGRGRNTENNSTTAANNEDGDEEVIVAVGAKLVEEEEERARIADEIKDEIYRTAVVGEATAMPNDRKTCWTIVGVFVVTVAIVGIVVGFVLGLAETAQSTQEPTGSMMPTITSSPTSWPSSQPTVTPMPSASPAPSSLPSVEPTMSMQPSSFPTSVYDMEYGLSVGRSPIRYSGLNATIRCLLGFSCEYQAYGFDFIFRPRTSAFVSAIVCGINNDSFRFVVYDYSCGFIPKVDPTNSSCWYYSFYAESPPGSNKRYNVTPMLPLFPLNPYHATEIIPPENRPPQTELGDFTLELVDNDDCFYAHIIDDTSSVLGDETIQD